jgi:glucose-6-phosphate-specific signal transduction histidine kinase
LPTNFQQIQEKHQAAMELHGLEDKLQDTLQDNQALAQKLQHFEEKSRLLAQELAQLKAKRANPNSRPS